MLRHCAVAAVVEPEPDVAAQSPIVQFERPQYMHPEKRQIINVCISSKNLAVIAVINSNSRARFRLFSTTHIYIHSILVYSFNNRPLLLHV